MNYLDLGTSSCACIFYSYGAVIYQWSIEHSIYPGIERTRILSSQQKIWISTVRNLLLIFDLWQVKKTWEFSLSSSVPCDYPIRYPLSYSNELNLLCLIAGTRTGAGVLCKIWVHEFLVECHVSLQTTLWPLLQGARLVSQGIDRWNDVYTSTCIVQKPEIYHIYQDEYPLS